MRLRLWLFILTTLVSSLSAGTTIISHGFVFPGKKPLEGWMQDMAKALCERNSGGTIRLYDPATGAFEKIKTHEGDQSFNVLLFDWSADSNDPEEGHSEAAGNALFCSLLMGSRAGHFGLESLHFIGHSRGCVVNSEAVERLIRLGKPVEQMTFLDPHDWGLHVTHRDYSVNPPFINSGIEAWEGVTWADAYWQEASIGLSGRPVNGAYSKKLDVTWHTDVFRWYTETIRNSGSKEGYYFSIRGGGSAHRPPRQGNAHPPYFAFLENSVYNGDFRFAPPLSTRIPGWSHHGGAGAGHIQRNALELDRGNGRKQHDRFYIPKDATEIVFDLKCNNADRSSFDGIDHLLVSVDQTVFLKLQLNQTDDNFRRHSIDIKAFQDQVVTLGFRIAGKSGKQSFITSQVKIDNVRLQ